MNRPSVELHIDKLVLRGASPRDRERFLAAVERELARLLERGGMVSPGDALGHRELHSARGKPRLGDNDLAAQVAQDIYQGLSTTGQSIPRSIQ